MRKVELLKNLIVITHLNNKTVKYFLNRNYKNSCLRIWDKNLKFKINIESGKKMPESWDTWLQLSNKNGNHKIIRLKNIYIYNININDILLNKMVEFLNLKGLNFEIKSPNYEQNLKPLILSWKKLDISSNVKLKSWNYDFKKLIILPFFLGQVFLFS